MSALKEFANFINLNLANLTETYAQLLAESDQNYAAFSADSRAASGRKLLKAVTKACETQTSDPLLALFDPDQTKGPRRWAKDITPSHPMTEVECLGQTLSPVVPNLEAGKFLWQMLARLRATIQPGVQPTFVPAVLPKETPDVDQTVHKELEERVKFLSYLVESSQVAQVTVNQNREITYINPYFSSLYGYQPAELLGQPFSILIGEDDPNNCLDSYFETATQGGVWRGEEKRKRKDGTIFPASISFTEILDEAGNIVTYLDVSRDLTERKQTDETLSQSEQRLALHIQQTPMAYVEWDLDFQVTEWNPAAETIFGFSKAEVLGRHALGLIIPAGAKDSVDQIWSDLLKQQGGTRRTVENITKDNRVIIGEWYNTPLVDRQGRVIGVASLMQDITQQRQLEKQLESLLEQRTRQVQISTEVAQEIATAPALDDLFKQVVNLIQAQFGYYHAHVYTLENDTLVMQEGTGSAGQEMKEKGHTIVLAAEQSLVARAARSGEPVLVPDVAQESGWLPNPLLPETRSELAVPIKLKNEILGVLDIQSNELAGLNQEDQIVLLGLCGQVAVAIYNRQVEAERQQTEEDMVKFKLGIERSTDAFFLTDINGTILYVNAAFEKVYGYSRAEAVGQTPRILKSGLISAEDYKQFWATLLAKKATAGEIINKTKDGRLITIEASNTPIINEHGEISGFLSIHRDATGRKQAELEREKLLAETEALYRILQILSHTGDQREMAESVLTEYLQALSLSQGGVLLFNDDQTEGTLIALMQNSTLVEPEMRIPVVGNPPLEKMIATKAPVVIVDALTDPTLEPVRDFVHELGYRSLLLVPIIIQGEVVGALGADSVDEIYHFVDREIELVKTVADRFGATLENQHLLNETQRRARREQTIREITEKMRAATSLEELVKTTAQELGQRFSAEYTLVDLGIEPGQKTDSNGHN